MLYREQVMLILFKIQPFQENVLLKYFIYSFTHRQEVLRDGKVLTNFEQLNYFWV